MLIKKILSIFLTDSGLDFNKLKVLITTSHSFQQSILNLNEDELNVFFKLLIDAKQPLTIQKLLKLLDSNQSEYNPALAVLGLIQFKILKSFKDFTTYSHLLVNINKNNALSLKPYFHLFPEKYQKIIEASIALQKQQNEAFREDLKDQIEFLKFQKLNNKALEIEQQLKFHFPEITETLLSTKQIQQKSKEHNYSKIIERNISFKARSKLRKATSNKYQKTLDSDASTGLKLANLWYSELKDTNPELLLTQLEFINFNNPTFYSKMLEEANLDIWTKIFLYIKSKKYLEGLNFLDINESTLLTESSSSIYNYYYTKGVMLLGAGMQAEAEEIFLLIKEQKENFRDIQLLLQDVK